MNFVTRARHDDSTSNLRRHVLTCAGNPAAASSGSIKSFAAGSKYTPASYRMKIALWAALHHRPFLIVEDPELLDIFLDLNSHVETPSASTVSHDVKEIFQMSQKCVGAFLQLCLDLAIFPLISAPFSELPWPSASLHRWLDSATSDRIPRHHHNLDSRCEDGESHSGFCEVRLRFYVLILYLICEYRASKAHTGIYLASRITEFLREYGIEKKVSFWILFLLDLPIYLYF
jgi:hypothetical protein